MSGAVDPSPAAPRRSVRRDAVWSLAYTAAVRMGTLGISIAVARLGGLHAAGAFGIALQVTALGSMIATFNLPQSLARHLAQSDDPARRRALLRASAWMVLGISVAVALLLVTMARPIGLRLYHDGSLAPIIAGAGALTLATAGCLWLEGALQGVRRFDRLARWGGLLSALDLVVGACAALFGVVAVVLARTVARLLAVGMALLRWGADLTRAPRAAGATTPFVEAEGAVVATLFGFAGPALLSAAIVLTAQTVLRALLVRGSGLDAAGHYQAADSIAQGLGLLPGAASVAFMRAVASAEGSRSEPFPAMLRRGLERITGANLPLCLLLIGVVPWVPELVFGRAFAPTRPVLVMLAAANGLMGPASIFGAAMLGRGDVWAGVTVNTLWAAVTLAVFALGASSLGAPGAALAVGIGYLALITACLVLARRWAVPVMSLVPTLLGTLAAVALAAAGALLPGVPVAVSTGLCVVLAAGAFLRWGRPALASPLAVGTP
jgi:O-antigen/teichoic acid export membrane protein